MARVTAAWAATAGAQLAPREATVTSEEVKPGLHVLYGASGPPPDAHH